MNDKKVKALEEQINKTIPLIEAEYNKNPSKMLALIKKRFVNAQQLILNRHNECVKEKDFYIKGASRAFLEVSTDYDNPLLEELGKTEELFSQVFN